MVKLIPVDPKEISTERLGRRGRVSYPILKQFLELKTKLVKIDLTGLDKEPTYLRSVLTAYVKSHKLPVKIFSADGEMYLMRLDLDNDGEEIKDWEEIQTTEGAAGHMRDTKPVPITSVEVKKRFKKEGKRTTK